MKQKKRLQ